LASLDAPRLRLSVFATTLGVFVAVLSAFAVLAVPALAVAPEVPEFTEVKPVFASVAVFDGTLSPKGLVPAEGSYRFLYRASKTECVGGSETVPGLALGGAPEVLPAEQVRGLAPATEYTVCLQITNLASETATSPPVTFKTAAAAAPEEPQIQPASQLTATAASLEGVVFAGSVPEPGSTYEFLFKATATATRAECESAGAGKAPVPPGEALAQAQAVAARAEGLVANTHYVACLLARNALNETSVSAPVPFKTAHPPETPEKLTGEPVGTGEPGRAGVKLEGVLNPAEEGDPGSYEFLYKQSASECTGGPSTPPQTATGGKEELATGEVTGLLPNTQYTFCLRAHNAAGEESALSAPVTLTTLAVAPVIGAETFSDVGSSSATLHATVDPGGAPTTYYFQYGPTTSYGSTTPVQSAGGGSAPVSVQAVIEGLTPASPVHFRAVATNAGHPAGVGTDTTFDTLPAAIPGLPDGRTYELVSPPENGDSSVVPHHGEGVRAAADGHALAYLTTIPPTGGTGQGEPPPHEESTGVETKSGDNQYLAERSGGAGWKAVNIQPTGVAPEDNSRDEPSPGYRAFSADLSEAVIESTEPLTGSAPASRYAGLYSRTTAAGALTPLFTRTPPSHPAPPAFETNYVGASANGSHQLFEANDALLEGTSPLAGELNVLAAAEAVNPLYDRTAGSLLPVDVLPDGQLAAQAAYGSPKVGLNARIRHRLDHVISADGSRIFWTDTSTAVTTEDPAGLTRLFVRENDASPGASTVQIDASEVPAGAGATETREREERSGAGTFMTASADGTKVYFTDDRDLTADANAAPGEPDLYEYNFEPAPGQPHLTDLTTTVQDIGAHEHAHVMGVLGASEDGTYIYFAAAGALAPNTQPQACAPPPPTYNQSNSPCNVYALHVGESPNLVAIVTWSDGEGGATDESQGAIRTTSQPYEAESGDWVPVLGDRLAEVSPDGRHLVFESIADLTGFDGGGTREIYLYGYGSGVTCVSCNPDGSVVLGTEEYSRHFELAESFEPTYAFRDMSASGNRVFFNSKEALVPEDQNNRTDVYEWEAPGEGTCAVGGPAYSSADHGCLYLLSGGTSTEYSAFLDADETGSNVFIATRAQLTGQNHGETYAVYDARVGAPAPPASTACTGTGCQGVPGAPPSFATPASVTFAGIGDFPPQQQAVKQAPVTNAQKLTKALRACRKHKNKHVRTSCERTAQRTYGKKKK
jgi:hypothetical protein